MKAFEALTQRLQVMYQFALSKQSRLTDLSNVTQRLDEINRQLNGRKLSFQVFSPYPLLREGMSNWLDFHQAFRNCYIPKISELPTFISSSGQSQSPKLILSANPSVSQSEARYKLSRDQGIMIGRDLQGQTSSSLVEISLPMYKKVSSCHAKICHVKSLNSTSISWQICDLNSTNGTYINGQQIKGCQILKSGDKITLGYPNTSAKAPEFIFENPSHDVFHTSSGNGQSIDADLVCLVISPNQELNNSEKELVAQLNQVNIAGFIVVIDNDGLNSQENQKLFSQRSYIQSWMQSQYPDLAPKSDIVALPLHPFYSNISPPQLSPQVQQQFNEFSENLISLAKTDGQAILLNRVHLQIQEQIQHIDQILSAQQESLNKERQRTESMLQNRDIEYWKEHFTRTVKLISEEREDFFGQARSNLNRESGDFISDIVPNNIIRKIDDFIKDLDPVVNKTNEQVSIQLQPSNRADISKAIFQFIRSEIIQWINQKWQHILVGELKELQQRSYSQLNCLPSFQMSNHFIPPSKNIAVENCFNVTFNDLTVDISYSESTGNAFGGIAKIAMMSTVATFNLSSGNYPQAIMQGANVVSTLTSMQGAAVSRAQQQQLKIEQVIDSLRRNTSNHYQKVARHLLSRVAQETLSAITKEERLFRKALEGFDEQFKGYCTEFKTITEGYKSRQQTLDQDKLAFEPIKRFSG
jgi:hypothetical protein